MARTVAWYLENDAWRAAIQGEGGVRERRGLATDTKGPAESGPREAAR